MSEAAKTREWPLVVFTVGLQLSCGLALATTLCDAKAAPTELAAVRPLGIAIFPILALAMLASVLHLGRPFAPWKSLRNLRHSRLSLEVLLTTLFALSVTIDSALWFAGRSEMRLALGLATSIAGLAAVFASATIYMLKTQPFWNSGWVPASFVGTTLMLGGVVCAGFAFIRHSGLLRLAIGATLAGSTVLFFSACWMLGRLYHLRAAQADPVQLDGANTLLAPQQFLCLGMYLLLAIAVPAGFAFTLWNSPASANPNTAFAFTVCLSAIIGAFLGRTLMYSLPASLSRF